MPEKNWFLSVHLLSGSEQLICIEEGVILREIYATDQLKYIQMTLAQPFHHLCLIAFPTTYFIHFLFLDRT